MGGACRSLVASSEGFRARFFCILAGLCPAPVEGSMEEKELRDALLEAAQEIGTGAVIDLLVSWITKGLYMEIFAEIQDKRV